MRLNLTIRMAIIFAVLGIFVFGSIGVPHGDLRQSITNRIHLGLDLKGGLHLVLQVHVSEAVGSAIDRDVVRLETDLGKSGITGATVGKTDEAHPQSIVISGVLLGRMRDARAVIQGA